MWQKSIPIPRPTHEYSLQVLLHIVRLLRQAMLYPSYKLTPETLPLPIIPNIKSLVAIGQHLRPQVSVLVLSSPRWHKLQFWEQRPLSPIADDCLSHCHLEELLTTHAMRFFTFF